MFSKKMKNARRLYREFVRGEDRTSQEDFYRTVDQRVLGDDDFVEWMRGRAIVDLSQGEEVMRSGSLRLREVLKTSLEFL